MFAVQYNFSHKTIVELIELGCNVNAVDEDGCSCLHHSYYCNDDDSSTFELLLNKGADPDLADNDKATGRSLANENPKYKNAFAVVVQDQDLATSLTRSEYERQQERSGA